MTVPKTAGEMSATGTAAFLALACSLALAACSAEKKPQAEGTDPALTGALGDRIVVDPEKSGDAADDTPVSLPSAARTPQAVAAARQSAADAAGGKLLPAPAPGQGDAAALARNAALAAQVTEGARAAKVDCSGKVQFSNAWATRLPAAIPVYPRAALHEAAGTDGEGCALRVVNYGTAVSPEDVVRFYYSMAQRGGYTAEYRVDGGDHVIGGRKGGQAFVAYARKLGSGVTEVDLVTSGK